MRIALLVAIAALVLAGCGEESEPGPGAGSGSGPELDGRTFIATSIKDAGADRLLAAGTELRLTFEDGNLGIEAGCNHLSGDYELDGDQLRLSEIGGTDMGCEPRLMAQDTWVAGLFEEPVTVALDDDELRITSGDVELVLTDREIVSPDAALEGTNWVLDAMISDDSVSSIPGEVIASIRIDDGVARLDTGCNAGTADVVVDDATLTFGELTLTAVGCKGARAEVERALTDVLTGTVTYVISEQSLTILRGSQGVSFRVA